MATDAAKGDKHSCRDTRRALAHPAKTENILVTMKTLMMKTTSAVPHPSVKETVHFEHSTPDEFFNVVPEVLPPREPRVFN